MRVLDLPIVLLSYDEPWANQTAEELRLIVPDLIRVHGVKGLDACHKAAAEAAGSDFFVTVDADTRMHPSFLSVTIDDCFISEHVRLSWHSRNLVNGLPSGNGSLKVWPSALVMAMRTHEIAPPDQISIDHDLAQVVPGVTGAIVLPGIHSSTNPAHTPEHAFRSGLREAIYLDYLLNLLSEKYGANSHHLNALRAILTAWITVGRHMKNGLWVIYGARLGLWLARTQPSRDPRFVNNYDEISTIWNDWVVPRFCPGGIKCRLSGITWDVGRLEAEVKALGRFLAAHSVSVCEFGAEESERIATAGLLPSQREGDSVDGLGWALLKGKGLNQDPEAARLRFEVAMAMGHGAAPVNLGRMMDTGVIANSDPSEIERLYMLAEARGNRHARGYLEKLQGSKAAKVGA